MIYYTAHHLIVKDGKIWVPTMGFPKWENCGCHDNCKCMQSFLASGVELENQLPNHGDRILLSSGNSISRFGNELWETYKHIYSGQWVTEAPIKENHPYQVPEFEFEVKQSCECQDENNVFQYPCSKNMGIGDDDEDYELCGMRKLAVIVEPVKDSQEDNLLTNPNKQLESLLRRTWRHAQDFHGEQTDSERKRMNDWIESNRFLFHQITRKQ